MIRLGRFEIDELFLLIDRLDGGDVPFAVSKVSDVGAVQLAARDVPASAPAGPQQKLRALLEEIKLLVDVAVALVGFLVDAFELGFAFLGSQPLKVVLQPVDNEKIEIDFDTKGTKTLLLAYAKLNRI